MLIHKFTAASGSYVPGPGATDIFTLCATGDVWVYRIHFAAIQGGSGNVIFSFSRRTTCNTGGNRVVVPSGCWEDIGRTPKAECHRYSSPPTTLGNLDCMFRTPPFTFVSGQPVSNLLTADFPTPNERGIHIPPGCMMAVNVSGLSATAQALVTMEFFGEDQN